MPEEDLWSRMYNEKLGHLRIVYDKKGEIGKARILSELEKITLESESLSEFQELQLHLGKTKEKIFESLPLPRGYHLGKISVKLLESLDRGKDYHNYKLQQIWD